MKIPVLRRRAQGYTFAEVLVASALLGLAIGATIALSATINTQYIASFNQSIAHNYQDNGARLWQLGLTSTEALALLPDIRDNVDLDKAIVPTATGSDKQLGFSSVANTTLALTMGTVEKSTCTVTIKNPVGAADRNLAVDAYRAKIR